MKWTDKEMKKAFGNREDHEYKHYSNALGMKIEGKEHFRKVLEAKGQISYDKSVEMANKNREAQKFTGISKETERKIHQIKQRADKNGKINWSDGLVRQLKDAGVDYSGYAKLPKHFKVDMDRR